MKEKLRRQVEGLFSKQKPSDEIHDMKEEIFTNLEARYDDYLSQGISEEAAFDLAIKQIASVDILIDGNKSIYMTRLWTHILQITLIYALGLWIFTIPARVLYEGVALNTSLLLIACAVGFVYVFFLYFKKMAGWDGISVVNTNNLLKWIRRAWILWMGFFIAVVVLITAAKLGSNLWFWKPVRLSGPYQYAVFFYPYLYPLLSIAIPILFTQAVKHVKRYEVSR